MRSRIENRAPVYARLLMLTMCVALLACVEPTQPRPIVAASQDGDLADNQIILASDTQIMVGRVEVMQDQTKRGLELLTGKHPPKREPYDADRDHYSRLVNTVRHYNALRKFACAAKVASGKFCVGAPYQPLWYAGRARPESYATLNEMAGEMQDTMVELWDMVCAKATPIFGDEHFCAIE